MVPDLHLGYYKNSSMVTRLHEDIILPARKAGVEKVRIVGVSMGGMGAVIYSLEHPGEIDEIILLAPFLGEAEVIEEIRSAGGLDQWRPGQIEETDFSRRIWLALKEKWKKSGSERAAMPRVLLGCGEEDRLAESSRLFANEFLEEDEQAWLPGDHDWPVWKELFKDLVQR